MKIAIGTLRMCIMLREIRIEFRNREQSLFRRPLAISGIEQGSNAQGKQ